MIKANEREIMLLRELYATPTRYYHTIRHAMSVTRATDELCKSNGFESLLNSIETIFGSQLLGKRRQSRSLAREWIF